MPRHVSYTEPLIGRRGIDPVAEAFLVGQNANKTSKDSIVREETLQGRSQIMLQSCGTHKGVRLERVFAEVGRWSRLATRASSLNRYSEYDYVLVESYFTARRHRGTLTAVELVSVFNVYQRLIDEVGHTPQRVVRSRVPREVEITCDESDRLCRSRSSSNVLALHHDDRRNTHINVCRGFWDLPMSNHERGRDHRVYDQVQWMLGALTQCKNVLPRPTHPNAPDLLQDTERYRNFAKDLSLHYGIHEDPPAQGIFGPSELR